MSDEIVLSAPLSGPPGAEAFALGGEVTGASVGMWNGIVSEFRNQVARLNAGTVQLRDALPSEVGWDVAPALADVDASLEHLSALTTCLDAMLDGGEQVISDLGDVINRALAMARPLTDPGLRLVVAGGRLGAVRNRNGAVECAIAAMIFCLARPSDARPATPPTSLRLGVFSSRGVLVIEIDSDGDRPSRSWRGLLAERLAAVVGGALEPLTDRVGLALRFE